MTTHPAISRLIAPVLPGTFLREYWEARPLVVSRGQPSYFDDLLTLDDLDRVITTFQLSHPTISVANAAREVRSSEYTRSDGMIDAARLYQQFAQGSTVIFNQLHRFVPALAALCRGLESEVSTHFQTNIYLTPRESQGLKVHYDSHDVMVLQIHGTKHWALYESPVELPYRNQSFSDAPVAPGKITQEFDMHPGDTLYLPRGVMHHAATTSVDSAHITVGVLQTSWTELLMEALGRAGLEDPAFRKNLPVGYARQGFDRTEARATFATLLRRFAELADFDGTLDYFSEDLLLTTREALLRGQLDQVRRLRDITPDARAGVRPDVLYRLRSTDEGVVVSANANDLRFPAHTLESLRFALESTSYAIRDLPGDLDDAGKTVLVRRLVREGLVRLL